MSINRKKKSQQKNTTLYFKCKICTGGPGTKLHERLARGDPGVNDMDRACKEHDIAYSKFKNVSERNIADKILGEKAWDRFKSSDASPSERAAAIAISSIMNAKSSIGMGLGAKITSFFNMKKNQLGQRNRIGSRYSVKSGVGCKTRKTKSALTDFSFLPPLKITNTKMTKPKNISMKMLKAAAAAAATRLTQKNKKKKKKKITIKSMFQEARAKAKEAISKKGIRTLDKAVPVAEKAAIVAVNRMAKKSKTDISPLEVDNELRIMKIPKTGGVLPLVPIFAGLSALGALMGGSASITNAVISSNRAKKELDEAARHNKTMEAISLGKNAHTGSGLYLGSYKTGLGLFIGSPLQEQQQNQLFQQKNV